MTGIARLMSRCRPVRRPRPGCGASSSWIFAGRVATSYGGGAPGKLKQLRLAPAAKPGQFDQRHQRTRLVKRGVLLQLGEHRGEAARFIDYKRHSIGVAGTW